MKKCNPIAVVILSTNLLACSEPAPAPDAPAQSAPAEAAAPTVISEDKQGILTDAQREGYNAANQVSGLLQDAEEQRRRQMEAQEKAKGSE